MLDKRLQFIVRTSLLLALTFAIQYFKLPTLITGSAVNAMLILSTLTVGWLGGVAIGALTPWMAFMVGIVKFTPMVPFIMAANTTLVLVFALLQRLNKVVAVAGAAAAKYGAFVFAIYYLGQVAGVKLPPAIKVSFGISQLTTALIGGVIALVLYHYVAPAIGLKGADDSNAKGV